MLFEHHKYIFKEIKNTFEKENIAKESPVQAIFLPVLSCRIGLCREKVLV